MFVFFKKKDNRKKFLLNNYGMEVDSGLGCEFVS